MRMPRIKLEERAFYHCISRVVDRQRLITASERERFIAIMRKVEGFCGVRVLTFAILSNHIHILTEVPEREELTDEEFLDRLRYLYDEVVVNNIAIVLEMNRQGGNQAGAELIRAPYLCRMYDLSHFMKTLKQKYTQSYNKLMGRKGTLWEERFKSMVLEGEGNPMAIVGAYLELNPIRAGMIADPKDYRHTGYGAAMGGDTRAREGIAVIMRSLGIEGDWATISSEYRKFIYMQGIEGGLTPDGKPIRAGFSPEEVQRVLDEDGKVHLHEALRCRVRYLTDGVALGRREFVEKIFRKHREKFGHKRRTGARPMKHANWDGLCTLRDLRLQVMTVPRE